MAVRGYVTHARANERRRTALFLLYILAFELVGAFALTIFLLIFDEEYTILSNPVGYALRYALPLAGVSALIFWSLYRGHAAAVQRRLKIRIVSRAHEPRFVAIAEEQCTALGVRFPRFGVVEVPEPNVITVGEGPSHGLIAVTRGLLDALDDDELAAVMAHEASHIRQGDTRLLAANHALMRTAVMLQTHNMLRIEDWRAMIIPLFLPPMMLILLAGSTATMLAMQLARYARRGIKLGRDHIADGEAIRATHFPDALLSALRKVGGRGRFRGSHDVEGLLFDGPCDHEGGSHPPVAERINAITALAGDLLAPGRQRRDSRGSAAGGFGRAPQPLASTAYPRDATGRPVVQPERGTLRHLGLYFTDREAYNDWQSACIDWAEWRAEDKRNALGLKPATVLPVAVTLVFIAVFHWPVDNDPAKFIRTFSPVTMVDVARMVNSGPSCTGPSYPDGKCPGTVARSSFRHESAPAKPARVIHDSDSDRSAARGNFSDAPDTSMPIFVGLMLLVMVLRPNWMRFLAGEVELNRDESGKMRWVSRKRGRAGPPPRERPRDPVPQPVAAARGPGGFGRKRV